MHNIIGTKCVFITFPFFFIQYITNHAKHIKHMKMQTNLNKSYAMNAWCVEVIETTKKILINNLHEDTIDNEHWTLLHIYMVAIHISCIFWLKCG